MTFIIAEIGINHNGNINIAKQLIDMAKFCGVDAVKFQKRTIDKVYTQEFLDSPRASPWGTTQRKQKEGLEFGEDEYDEINSYCRKVGIDWFASAWDIDSQVFLSQYNLKYNKVAHPMLKNKDLLYTVAEERKPTFISVTKDDDDSQIIPIFKGYDCPFTLLHCVHKYPCSSSECNISRIGYLHSIHPAVGYSSHYPGILDKIIAVMMGAEVLEMHITLDRAMYGSDQPASVEKAGLERVVREVNLIKEMM